MLQIEPPYLPGKFNLNILKRRREFLRVARGRSLATPGLVLQASARSADQSRSINSLNREDRFPRFGFTVTKRIGNAVVRNRVKRRLREAVRLVAPDHAKQDFDYVLIGRHGTANRDFMKLLLDLKQAFEQIHTASRRGAPRRKTPKKGS